MCITSVFSGAKSYTVLFHFKCSLTVEEADMGSILYQFLYLFFFNITANLTLKKKKVTLIISNTLIQKPNTEFGDISFIF